MKTDDRRRRLGRTIRAPLGGIALRFWLVLSSSLALLFLMGGALEGWLTYRESIDASKRIQGTEARAAATQIAGYLHTIESQIAEVVDLPWGTEGFGDADQLEEFHRLMKLAPAVAELSSIDADGIERVFASRIDADRIGSGRKLADDQVVPTAGASRVDYGDLFFLEGTRPHIAMAVKRATATSGPWTRVVLDLTFVTRIVQQIRVGHEGIAYVVDRHDRLVAHPNLSFVLRRTILSALPQVEALHRVAHPPSLTMWGESPGGGEVLVSTAPVGVAEWMVFVEQPVSEAIASVRDTLLRTVGLLILGLIVTTVASAVLARQLAKPILELRRGVRRFGDGDLSTRIATRTRDEIGDLANEFNRMAESLAESNANLEAKVEARTLELARSADQVRRQAQTLEELNDQLNAQVVEIRTKKDEADRANAAKTRFLAAASHDLRQPMHTISLLTGLLQERLGAPDQEALIEKVRRSVDNMERLFVSLLDISKLDSGAIKPAVSDVDVSSLLTTLAANHTPLAEEKGLRFKVVGCRAIVSTDSALLERILSNLISNAIRHTSHGKVLLGCRRCGARLRILVIDTGPGIANDRIDLAFEEFVQLGNTHGARDKGLGLGLSIVKRTAALLDIPVIVRSSPGRGSTFGVELPRKAPCLPADERPGDSESGEQLSRSFVLVIEDESDSRVAMEQLLVRWGAQVSSASSAEEAVALLEHHLRTPDVIISDYRLQGRDSGVEAIARLRAKAESDIPAVIVTGDTTSIDIGSVPGRFRLLHKPVNPFELRRAVETLLAPAGGDRS